MVYPVNYPYIVSYCISKFKILFKYNKFILIYVVPQIIFNMSWDIEQDILLIEFWPHGYEKLCKITK